MVISKRKGFWIFCTTTILINNVTVCLGSVLEFLSPGSLQGGRRSKDDVIYQGFYLAEEGTGFDTKVSHFQISKKNPNLKKCALNILHENDYLGVRVSEKTGKCDQHISVWGVMQPGYAYGKKTFEEQTFQPPIPGVFVSGARLDVSIQIKKPEDLGLNIYLDGTVDIRCAIWRGRFSYNERRTIKKEFVNGNKSYAAAPVAFASEGVVKLFILAHSDSVTMSVENKEFVTVPVDNVRSLFRLSVFTSHAIGGVIGIHRIEFIGK